MERSAHVAILRWLRANVSDLVWHNRNEAGAGRDARWGSAQKALGIVAGASDLVGVAECGRPGVFFAVEVKRPGWRESDVDPVRLANQRRFGAMVVERGGLFTFASTVEEVEAWARDAGILRAAGWRMVRGEVTEEWGL